LKNVYDVYKCNVYNCIPIFRERERDTHKYIGSLDVKLPTIWTDETQRWEESEKRREEERTAKRRKSQKKEDQVREKARNIVFFSNDLWFRRVEK
jgi:hypothetical protein